MEVRVKKGKMVYYDLKRRREGQVFEIKNEQEFSYKSMEPLGWRPKGPAPKGYELPEEEVVDLDLKGEDKKDKSSKKPNNKKQPPSEDRVI